MNMSQSLTQHQPTAPKIKIAKGSMSLNQNTSREALSESLGTRDLDLTTLLTEQLANANGHGGETYLNATLAIVHGAKPQDELESLLVAQMATAHNLAMEFLKRAVQPDSSTDKIDANIKRATSLQRTFIAQLEALNRYRNRGQQQIQVQHVNVNGQAVIGDVHHSASGGGG